MKNTSGKKSQRRPQKPEGPGQSGMKLSHQQNQKEATPKKTPSYKHQKKRNQRVAHPLKGPQSVNTSTLHTLRKDLKALAKPPSDMRKRETPTPSKGPRSEHTSNPEQTNITRERESQTRVGKPQKKPCREKASMKASKENLEAGQN
jgi:hypothetical protein